MFYLLLRFYHSSIDLTYKCYFNWITKRRLSNFKFQSNCFAFLCNVQMTATFNLQMYRKVQKYCYVKIKFYCIDIAHVGLVGKVDVDLGANICKIYICTAMCKCTTKCKLYVMCKCTIRCDEQMNCRRVPKTFCATQTADWTWKFELQQCICQLINIGRKLQNGRCLFFLNGRK